MDILLNVCVTTFVLFVVSFIIVRITNATAVDNITYFSALMFVLSMFLIPVYIILWVWM